MTDVFDAQSLSEPILLDELSAINIFTVVDQSSRYRALIANMISFRWNKDIDCQVSYWQGVLLKIVRTQDSALKVEASDLDCITNHVMRTHSAWMQSRKTFGTSSQSVTIPDEDIPLYLDRMMARYREELTPFAKREKQQGLYKDQKYDKCLSLLQELKQATATSREQSDAECFRGVDEKIYDHINEVFPDKKAMDGEW